MRRPIGAVVGLLFLTMIAVQVVGVAFALRRKRDAVDAPDPASDEVELTSIFGPLEFTSTSQAFRGGSLTCFYGGGIVDLRGATLAPDGATLRVEAWSGGAQILVPESWRVEMGLTAIFGGVGDARPQADRPADAPLLRIEGWAVFGGFGIASQGPRGMEDRAAAAADARIGEGT